MMEVRKSLADQAIEVRPFVLNTDADDHVRGETCLAKIRLETEIIVRVNVKNDGLDPYESAYKSIDAGLDQIVNTKATLQVQSDHRDAFVNARGPITRATILAFQLEKSKASNKGQEFHPMGEQ